LEEFRKIKSFLFFKYYLFGGGFVGDLGKGSVIYGNIKYAVCDTFILPIKTWSFPAKAGSSMGLACPALRGSEFFGSA
jgi:hypothetical protein